MRSDKLTKYSTLQSDTIFRGKVFNVRIDTLRAPNGTLSHVDVVEHGGAVVLVPIDKSDRIWFVRQYRHPAGRVLLELPAGTLEPDEDPEVCAVRECREEIGLHPANLQFLGSTFLAPGYSTERLEYFLATELTPSPLPGDEGEDISAEPLTWQVVMDEIRTGGIQDAKSLAGLLLARTSLEGE